MSCFIHSRFMKASVELAASGGTYDFDYTNKWGKLEAFFQSDNAAYGPSFFSIVFCDGQTASDATITTAGASGYYATADTASKVCAFRTGNIVRIKNNTAAKIRMAMFGYFEDKQSLG